MGGTGFSSNGIPSIDYFAPSITAVLSHRSSSYFSEIYIRIAVTGDISGGGIVCSVGGCHTDRDKAGPT